MVILMNFEVYEDGVRKTNEQLGIAVLRFSDEQILKDMENVIRAMSFIFGSMKTHTLALSRGELEV
jgi:very-short-patch-repair endonuclease